MNTYQLNQETGKIELHFSYEDYKALPIEDKSKIKSAFLFSRFASAWVSRAKAPNLYRPEQIAKELKLTKAEDKGEKLSFAEQVERTQVKAEARAERMEVRAEKAENESEAQYKRSHDLVSVIPMGQPILVGHHSERGHRKLLEKADNAMRKSCEADEKAKYYEDRAETAKRTASGEQMKNVNYLLNRISEGKAAIRKLERYLKGEGYVNRETGERAKPEEVNISEATRNHLETRISEETEKLDFFLTKLQEAGGGQMTAERMKEGKPAYILAKGTWYPLKSINRDTVTVLNWMSIARFTWKFKFDRIKSMQSINGTVIVHDRDGNEVKPTIKYK